MFNMTNESQLVHRLCAGDEEAFTTLVDLHHRALFKMAMIFVADANNAEELVQETWLTVIGALEKFEGRSTLKTWIFGILVNKAKKKMSREARRITKPSYEELVPGEANQGRFRDGGHWSVAPRAWEVTPEDTLLRKKLYEVVQRTIEALPNQQRAVVTMRDLEGFSTAETCEVLAISDNHHRVLLHRARAAIREAVEVYLTDDEHNQS